MQMEGTTQSKNCKDTRTARARCALKHFLEYLLILSGKGFSLDGKVRYIKVV